MSPRLLLIAPPNSYRTTPYLVAARQLGVDVLVASEGKYSLVSEIAGGLHVDLASSDALDTLLEANRQRPFCGVVATDDATVELGSRISATLGLPHNTPQSARYSHRKDLSRKVLREAGVTVPDFRLIDLDRPLAIQLQSLPLPAVIKPLSLSGSRGVIRVDTHAQAELACERIRRIVAGERSQDDQVTGYLLMETFVPGPEVALEGLLRGGELAVLAIFDKPDPLDGPFFEETYYITPSRHVETVQQDVIACVQAACHALGLREGPVHAEVRIAAEGCFIMEVAARTIGGECARLLRFGTGHSLEELVIAHATGQFLAPAPAAGGAGVLMIPIEHGGILRRIEGVAAARAVPGIEDVSISIREGYELQPLPEGSSYLGFIFARAESAEDAEAALRAAHAELNVVVAPLLRMQDERGIG